MGERMGQSWLCGSWHTNGMRNKRSVIVITWISQWWYAPVVLLSRVALIGDNNAWGSSVFGCSYHYSSWNYRQVRKRQDIMSAERIASAAYGFLYGYRRNRLHSFRCCMMLLCWSPVQQEIAKTEQSFHRLLLSPVAKAYDQRFCFATAVTRFMLAPGNSVR